MAGFAMEYALDVPHLEIQDALRGRHVMSAIDGHILAKATITGTYSLNPRLASGR
jgi:phosphatidylethanolamine-binding protein (PEBP) family uncharacterized protein